MKNPKVKNVLDVQEIVKNVLHMMFVIIIALINVIFVMVQIKINVHNVYTHLEI